MNAEIKDTPEIKQEKMEAKPTRDDCNLFTDYDGTQAFSHDLGERDSDSAAKRESSAQPPDFFLDGVRADQVSI
jgi:hypothetical protein